MIKYIFNITIISFSFSFSAYYAIGDTVNVDEHLNHPIEICHSLDSLSTGTTIHLSDNIGKITILGLEIPW